jgi:hypothetical protein
VSTREIHAPCRKDDRRPALRAQLACKADSGARDLQVDIDQCNIGPAILHQLHRFFGGVRGTKHRVACILDRCSGAVGDNPIVFDDQYDHYTVRFLPNSTNRSDGCRRGFRARRHLSEKFGYAGVTSRIGRCTPDWEVATCSLRAGKDYAMLNRRAKFCE